VPIWGLIKVLIHRNKSYEPLMFLRRTMWSGQVSKKVRK